MAIPPTTADSPIAELLSAAQGYTGPSVADLPLAQARVAYGTRYRERGIPSARRVPVEELQLPTPAGPLNARLYRGEPGGALALYFHGGGFMLGDLEAYDAQSHHLTALSGVSLLSVDYRLAPEHRFPAPQEDATAAARWAVENAAKLGLDPQRVGLAGDSAGGGLALQAALALPGQIRGVLALYPVSDMRPFGAGGAEYPSIEAFGEGFFLDTRLMVLFTEAHLTSPEDALDPRASPLLAPGLGALPPVTIVTAGHDPLRDMGAALAARIRESGGTADYHCEAEMVHNFMGHAGVSAGAKAAFERTAARLAALLA